MAKRRATKRGNAEGSIYRRKDGRYAASITVDGKRHTAYAKTRAEANDKLQEFQGKQKQGIPLATSQTPLREYLEQWLEGIQNRVRPSTYEGYEIMVRVHLIPALGHIRLGKLAPEHIEGAYAAMLAEGKSAIVIEHAHLRLSKALNDAMRRQLIYRNACQAVTPPRAVRRELHPPDAQAIRRLLEAARSGEYYETLYTAFYTGLRRGELLALRWRDVDLNMGTVSVSRSLFRGKGGQSIYQDPKTAKGRRLVSLTPSTVLMLRGLRERQQGDALLRGYQVNEESLVFRYRDGAPILPRALDGAFKKIVRTTGMEDYRLHDARHAHATLMLRQGVHPKIVQERLGHSRIAVTLDIYSHVTPGLQEAAALRFEEGLNAAYQQEAMHQL
ncbi:MAG: site-specific integrase [Chloroflexota bacterium]